mmetsp:Transcript_58134/g.188156  ORF Transcript_58134/g.188156 Transcript_58134/m.188156 type:complete len:519 (-) Transcript_58134:465-2021(-)
MCVLRNPKLIFVSDPMPRVAVQSGEFIDCHSLLGVADSASFADLRAAYLRRALQVHPDKGGSASEFQKVIAAFEYLATASRERETITSESLARSMREPRPSPAQAPNLNKARTRATKSSNRQQSAQDGKTVDVSYGDGFYGKLYGLLSRFSTAQRRQAIAQLLSEGQRLSLERWLKRRKEQSAATPGVDPTDREAGCDESMSEAGTAAASFLPLMDTLERAEADGCDEAVVDPGCFDGAHPSSGRGARSARWRSKQKSAHRGVINHNGSYHAIVCVGWLALRTQGRKELLDALGDHMALVAVRRCVVDAVDCMSAFPERLRSAVAEVAAEYRCSTTGWVGWTQLPAFYWIGKQLRTNVEQWEDALATWQRLVSCMGYCTGSRNCGRAGFLGRPGMTPEKARHVWLRLKAEYLRVAAECGGCVGEVSSRLSRLEEARQPTRELGIRRFKARMAAVPKEQRLRRRLEALLRVEARRAAAQERREAYRQQLERKRCFQERMRKRRRVCSRDLTMEDLFAGR